MKSDIARLDPLILILVLSSFSEKDGLYEIF